MKVLVADDDIIVRKLLNKLLSSWGYQVVLAADGDEAWKVLNDSDPPQIAVLDWVMSGKTGIEICAECQKAGLSVYRILLTAKEKDEEMMYALDQGAHDFKSKPIKPEILKSRLAVGKRLVEAIQDTMRAERLAAVGSLVAGVAHHFNNLNLPVLMYASSILKKTDLDTKTRKKVEKIEKAAIEAGDLTEKLMSIASNKHQKKELEDLNHLTNDAIEINSITFDKDEISVRTDLKSIPKVLIDINDIRHVVVNLLGNACHALIASPEKKIIIKTGMENNQLYLQVTDTGCGIAANKLQKIFSPFYSEKGEFAEPESPFYKVKGVGIGLYASKNIATDHGGDITVKSQVGHGSTFTLWLPVAQEFDYLVT
jgi:signal transduction histidine kinase